MITQNIQSKPLKFTSSYKLLNSDWARCADRELNAPATIRFGEATQAQLTNAASLDAMKTILSDNPPSLYTVKSTARELAKKQNIQSAAYLAEQLYLHSEYKLSQDDQIIVNVLKDFFGTFEEYKKKEAYQKKPAAEISNDVDAVVRLIRMMPEKFCDAYFLVDSMKSEYFKAIHSSNSIIPKTTIISGNKSLKFSFISPDIVTTKLMKAICQHAFDMNRAYGQFPLEVAVKMESLPMVKVLLEDSQRNPEIQKAALKALVSSGKDLELMAKAIKDAFPHNPALLGELVLDSINSDSRTIPLIFFKLGAPFNIQDSNGNVGLMLILRKRLDGSKPYLNDANYAMLNNIIDTNYPDVEQNEYGVRSWFGLKEAASNAISKPLSETNNLGESLLSWAASRSESEENTKLIRMLLKKGADAVCASTVSGYPGKSPMEEAMIASYFSNFSLILNHTLKHHSISSQEIERLLEIAKKKSNPDYASALQAAYWQVSN